MPQIKIFKFTPENEKAITELLQTVNILGEGLLISDGHIGIMYKEKTDVGTGKEGMINEVGKELVKAQKQFANQECLERAYGEMIAKFTALDVIYTKEFEEADLALKTLIESRYSVTPEKGASEAKEVAKKKYDAEKNRLELASGEAKLKMANNRTKIKENVGLKDTATEDKAHALVFIETASKLIADINAGTLDLETNVLTFKQ